MKRYISLLFLTCFAWGKTTIAVFDFSNNGLSAYEVRTLTDRLRTELVQNGDFKVVERSKIDEILKEQKFQMSGCVDECLIEVGKMLGATKVVIGSVGKVGGTYTISARLVDAETGEIEKAISYDSKYDIDLLLTEGMKEVAFKLLDKPFVGNIFQNNSYKTNNIYNQNNNYTMRSTSATDLKNYKNIKSNIPEKSPSKKLMSVLSFGSYTFCGLMCTAMMVLESPMDDGTDPRPAYAIGSFVAGTIFYVFSQ